MVRVVDSGGLQAPMMQCELLATLQPESSSEWGRGW